MIDKKSLCMDAAPGATTSGEAKVVRWLLPLSGDGAFGVSW